MSEACSMNKNDSALLKAECLIAVVGAPNSGKSTLFTQLTGTQSRPVNYPGSTVDALRGFLRKKWKFEAALIDTPGTYSLTPRTIEEEVTYRVLSEGLGKAVSSVVITVVDATQLSRHLLLVRQLQRAGYRPIVALSMTDLMRSAGQDIDVKKLSSILEAPVVRINALTGEGVAELIDQTRVLVESMGAAHSQKISRLSQSQPEDLSHQETEKFLNEAVAISKTVICGDLQSRRQADLRTQRWDRVLLHPFWGLLVFVLVMSSVFSTIFWLSAPMMDLIDGFFAWSAEQVLELAPQAAWSDLVANGILASLGAVLVFLPQIALLFLFMSLLESSGYLARAASLVDKPLSFLGMNGRSFVPLLSGYACAIPAMLAARTIPSRRERWITLFIVPLMSCSARLPVYALLLSFVFRDESAWKPGLALAGLYFGSLWMGSVVAFVSSRFIQVKDKSFFLMELPLYRKPHGPSVIRSVYLRTRAYLLDAGPVIFVFAVLLWAATQFPKDHAQDPEQRLSGSYAAQAGRFLEPIMEPMGGDWRTGTALIAAFAAREVFVSSLAVTLHVSTEEEGLHSGLLQKMTDAVKADGTPLFTLSSVIGLAIFFMIALQCMATVGVARREFGGWRWAIFQLISFNLLAYGLAVAVVQSMRALGWS